MSLPANFPTSLDAMANPTAMTNRNDSGFELHAVISRAQDILEALEAKVGIGASSPIANRVLRGTAPGVTAWAQVASGDIAVGAVGAAEHAITPSASVYHSASQSIGNNTNTLLAFDSEAFDTDTIHSTTTNNGRLTVQTAGVYVLVAQVQWVSNPTNYRQVFLKYNGASNFAENTIGANGSGATTQILVAVASLAVSDYVEAWVAQGSGAPLNVQGGGGQPGPWFSAVWTGKAT